MAKRTDSVYVDTSAFISFLDRSDTHHALFARRFGAPPNLITSTLVVAEGHGWFLKRYDSTRALQFLNFIGAIDILKIVPVGVEEVEKGVALIRKFSDQPLTLVDAVGLFIIREKKVSLCWSTDRHLTLTGAELVIHRY